MIEPGAPYRGDHWLVELAQVDAEDFGADSARKRADAE
jgi:hypothetical protein